MAAAALSPIIAKMLASEAVASGLRMAAVPIVATSAPAVAGVVGSSIVVMNVASFVGGAVTGYKLFRHSREYRELVEYADEYKRILRDRPVEDERITKLNKLIEETANKPDKMPELRAYVEEIRGVVQELQDAESTHVCVVCDGVATHAFDCGHMCVCETCAHRVMAQNGFGNNAKCPMCRAPTRSARRIYMP